MFNSNNVVVVSRHPAAIKFIAEYLGNAEADIDKNRILLFSSTENLEVGEHSDEIRVIKEASKEDIKDKIVYGNLPLDLAAHAKSVYSVLFEKNPPRGKELTLDNMVEAGATIRKFKVEEVLE